MRVCVLGAGASGLVAIKELVAEGHDVQCFEASDRLGGVFSLAGSKSNRVYKNLLLTISNYYMSFSDMMPEDGLRYWTGAQYYDYLKRYAQRFDIERLIHYNSPVLEVQRLKAKSKWSVLVSHKGEEKMYEFDAVAVCCGTHQHNRTTAFPGQDKFKGEIVHSSSYLDPKDFTGRDVLIVGMGESSADLTRDVSSVARSCHLLMRSYPLVVPRMLRNGMPADCGTSRIRYIQAEDSFLIWGLCLIYALLYWILVKLRLVKWWNTYDNNGLDSMGQQTPGKYMDFQAEHSEEAVSLMASWFRKGSLSIYNKFATKNSSWIPNVLCGKCKPHISAIESFSEDGVTLSNGEFISCNRVLLCTGYVDRFPFMKDKDLIPELNDVRSLFKHSFHPKAGHTLCYLGFVRPTTGAIPACSELTARYFALLLSGKRQLPADMEDRIIADKEKEDSMFYNSLAVRTVVNPTDWMDSVAKLIGCYVSPLEFWWSPSRFLKWQICHCIPARYRLKGPHATPKEAQAWLDSTLTQLSTSQLLPLAVYRVLNTLGIGTGDLFIDYRRWYKKEIVAEVHQK